MANPKEDNQLKRVVIDLSHYDDLCGFGEICRNFAPRLAETRVEGLRWVFVLPERRVGLFGDSVDYIVREQKRRSALSFPHPIHLWHATDQQFHYRLRRSGVKQLLTVHDLNFLYEKTGLHRLRHIIQLRLRVANSDHITTISNYVKAELKTHIPTRGKHAQVIYNGIADTSREPMERPAFVDEAPFFFTLGQIREKKNFQKLVPMMRHFPNHKLYICGDDHFSFAMQLRVLIAQDADLAGRCIMTGTITAAEKRWLYAHCEAFLFPSRLEGFGIPVLEAMRHGARVVSSSLSSLPEVCAEHAVYWQDFEPEAMAQVVKDGIAGWQRDGKRAKAEAAYSQTFSYDSYTQQYVALYCQMLGL